MMFYERGDKSKKSSGFNFNKTNFIIRLYHAPHSTIFLLPRNFQTKKRHLKETQSFLSNTASYYLWFCFWQCI